jgi:hypothetical protein
MSLLHRNCSGEQVYAESKHPVLRPGTSLSADPSLRTHFHAPRDSSPAQAPRYVIERCHPSKLQRHILHKVLAPENEEEIGVVRWAVSLSGLVSNFSSLLRRSRHSSQRFEINLLALDGDFGATLETGGPPSH